MRVLLPAGLAGAVTTEAAAVGLSPNSWVLNCLREKLVRVTRGRAARHAAHRRLNPQAVREARAAGASWEVLKKQFRASERVLKREMARLHDD